MDEQRFTMLTTEANDGMEEYHDRMPVILHIDEQKDWLDGYDFSAYLNRIPPELNATRMDWYWKSDKREGNYKMGLLNPHLPDVAPVVYYNQNTLNSFLSL